MDVDAAVLVPIVGDGTDIVTESASDDAEHSEDDAEPADFEAGREGPPDEAVGFVVRSEESPNHAGHVGFPGGKREPCDEDLRATALREAREEVGLDPADVALVRELPIHRTRTSGFHVRPFVGRVAPTARLVPDEREVTDAFALSTATLLDRFTADGDRVRYPGEPQEVWGLTARILTTLLEREYGLTSDCTVVGRE